MFGSYHFLELLTTIDTKQITHLSILLSLCSKNNTKAHQRHHPVTRLTLDDTCFVGDCTEG